MLTTKQIRDVTKKLDEIIKKYKLEQKEKQIGKKRDWKTYEQRLAERIKYAIRNLDEYITEAIHTLKRLPNQPQGRPSKLSLKQKVQLLLIKAIVGKSNRGMSSMLMLFSLLTNIDVSYKTIERLYSDTELILVINNLHRLLLKEKNIENIDSSGDSTGYSLSIKEHYASCAQELKDKAKKSTKKRKFVYNFTLMDLKTRMYMAYGTSYYSEKDAYNKAIGQLKENKISVKSIRLDRYYSMQKTVKDLSKLGIKKFLLIPKKNATIKGSQEWKQMMKSFVENTKEYLKDYFQRNQSESGFSEDKRRFGWKIAQKLDERINTAIFTRILWHNLFWLS